MVIFVSIEFALGEARRTKLAITMDTIRLGDGIDTEYSPRCVKVLP